MLLVFRNRESGVFDVCLDFLGVNLSQPGFAESLANEEFRSCDVIGGQGCIRGSIRYGHQIALGTADITTVAVAPANSPHIANVVTEQGDHEVQPVARRDATLAGVLAA